MAAAPLATPGGVPIGGHSPERWAHVRAAFERNFDERGELGAALCVVIDGEEVLHLWGGYSDAAGTQPWMRDTLVAPASAIKGLYPFAVHKLVADGRVDYDDLVTRYWPAFGANGKESTTVRHLISHSAGLQNSFSVDVYRTPLQDLFKVMEAATPVSPPGSHGAYHSQTHMPLVAALVFKITGEEINSYFRREIAGPWGLDAWLSLPRSEFGRTAEGVIPADNPFHGFMATAAAAGETAQDLVLPPGFHPFYFGAVTAPAFARLYGAIADGGTRDGVRLFPEDLARGMGATQWTNRSGPGAIVPGLKEAGVADKPETGALGAFKGETALVPVPNPNAFGNPGAGGNLVFADPDRRMGVGYVLNRWSNGPGLGPRAEALISAIYAAV